MSAPDCSPRRIRLNLLGHVIDGALWVWAFNTFCSLEVILPWLISGLGGSAFQVGLIPFVMQAGFLTPQVFAAPFIERFAYKRYVVLTLGGLMRLPFLGLAFLLYWGHTTGHLPSAWTILAVLLLAQCLAGCTAPAWLDFLADTIPVQYRGRQFAIRICIGGGLGVLTGPFAVGYIQSRYPFPLDASIFLVVLFILITIGLCGLLIPRELQVPASRRHESLRHYLTVHVVNILRNNRNFRTFLFVKALGYASSGISLSFFTIYGLRRFDLDESWIGTFAGVLMAGTLTGPFLLGVIADKYGHRLNLMVSWTALALVNIWALIAPNVWSYCIVFFFLSMYRSSEVISYLGMSVEFSTPEDRPTYIAVANSTMLPVLLAGGLGGILYDYAGPRFVFITSAFLALAAIALTHKYLVEPREAPFIIPEVPPER